MLVARFQPITLPGKNEKKRKNISAIN